MFFMQRLPVTLPDPLIEKSVTKPATPLAGFNSAV
jgi:hypothetical protein